MTTQLKPMGRRFGVIFWSSLAALSACEPETDVQRIDAPLSVECRAADAAEPDDAWICPAPRQLECSEVDSTTLFVTDSDETRCAGQSLELSDAGPFAVGTHTLDVLADDQVLCSAELTVVDTEPAVAIEHDSTLWPPNHKLHTVDVADCVSATDACDGELRGEFIWASSDEPANDKGDGNHEPDIVLDEDCQSIELRAERQGGGDGRVYTLGVRLVDGAGNETEGECHVTVAHDQSGRSAVDSGEAYRLTFDGSDGAPICGAPDEDAGSPDEDAG